MHEGTETVPARPETTRPVATILDDWVDESGRIIGVVDVLPEATGGWVRHEDSFGTVMLFDHRWLGVALAW